MQILVLGQILTHSYINCLHFQVSCSWHNYYKVITIAANSTAEGPNLRQHRKNRMKTGRNTINSPKYNLYTKLQNNEEFLKLREFINKVAVPFSQKKRIRGGGVQTYMHITNFDYDLIDFKKLFRKECFFLDFEYVWGTLENTIYTCNNRISLHVTPSHPSEMNLTPLVHDNLSINNEIYTSVVCHPSNCNNGLTLFLQTLWPHMKKSLIRSHRLTLLFEGKVVDIVHVFVISAD